MLVKPNLLAQGVGLSLLDSRPGPGSDIIGHESIRLVGSAAGSRMIREGDIAPAFTARTDEDKVVSLSDFLGKKVVLYFYPKDDTPG